jgi:probable HAF family extracellular repeat protein
MLIHLPRLFGAILWKRLWLGLAIPVLSSGLAWSQEEYILTDLGTLGGSKSAVIAVNNAGQVIGSAAVTGSGHSDPFLYSNGKMTDVWTGGTQFGGTTVAINNNGHFVVNYNLDAAGDTESFLWDGVIWSDLGIGGATGMNSSDTVVGNGPKGYWECSMAS